MVEIGTLVFCSRLELARGEEDRCSNSLVRLLEGQRKKRLLFYPPYVKEAARANIQTIHSPARILLSLKPSPFSPNLPSASIQRLLRLIVLLSCLAGANHGRAQGYTAVTSGVPDADGVTARITVPIAETEQQQIADSLRAQPEHDYEFNRASLRDVLRFLAQDAGISYVSVPEIDSIENNLVTFSLHASPFHALEIIAKANGIALFYEDGVWYLRPYNDKELVGRTYKLKYNTQEDVTYNGSGSSSPSAASTGMGGTQSGGGTVPDLGLSLSGNADVFKTNPKQLIDDIKALLGIPTTGFEATIAKDATVDRPSPLGTSPSAVEPASPDGGGKDAAGVSGGPQVIWNSDSNTLYVVATRQQQQWVEGYLASMDRPQALIAIEVKFFESTKDPRKQLGVDWSGTLQEGFTVKASDISVSPTGTITVDQKNDHQSQYGSLPPGSDPYNFHQGNKTTTATFGAPYSAVLSASNVAATIRAFLNDRDTSTASYPRVLTRNNREVVIRSVVNQPVLASTSSVTPGVGGTTTASVSYLPIGTIINVLPKTMADGSVMLNVAITISSIIGEQPIQGNSYPIATTRVYNAALQVDSGYTLAIGGIEEATDLFVKNGVPFLRDIPLLGRAFRSDDQSRSKKNLMFFITPTILGAHARVGIAQPPESTIPITPAEPSPPALTPDGRLVGGEPALANAIAWLSRREQYYQEFIKESRTDHKTIEQIQGLINLAEALIAQAETYRQSGTVSESRIAAEIAQLTDIRIGLLDAYKKARKNLIDLY